jgi:hypothetical protein
MWAFFEADYLLSIAASAFDTLVFSYSTKVAMMGNHVESLEILDLPLLPAFLRAAVNYSNMRTALQGMKLRIGSWRARSGSGWNLLWQLIKGNGVLFVLLTLISAATAVVCYGPAFFMRQVIRYLETDPERKDRSWGLVCTLGLFLSGLTNYLRTLSGYTAAHLLVFTSLSHPATVVPLHDRPSNTIPYAVEHGSVREDPCQEGYSIVWLYFRERWHCQRRRVF